MFLLWAYSLYLTYRAWYKLLYSDGDERDNKMWRFILDVVRKKRKSEGDLDVEQMAGEEEEGKPLRGGDEEEGGSSGLQGVTNIGSTSCSDLK